MPRSDTGENAVAHPKRPEPSEDVKKKDIISILKILIELKIFKYIYKIKFHQPLVSAISQLPLRYHNEERMLIIIEIVATK